MRPHRYSPADDKRIRAAFALPPRTRQRRWALLQLALDLGATSTALKNRHYLLTVLDKGGKRGTAGRFIKKPEPRPVPQPPGLPVARPSWMQPITREQLMAGR